MDQKHAQSLDEPCLWMKLACNWFWHFVCLGTTVCLLCSPATGNVRNCVIPEQKPVCTNSPALSMLTKGSVGAPHTVNSDACGLQALLPPRVHYRFIPQDVPKSSVFLFFWYVEFTVWGSIYSFSDRFIVHSGTFKWRQNPGNILQC